jgi:hypothetical protein
MPILTPKSPEFIRAIEALNAYDFIMREAIEYPGLEYLDPPKGPGFQYKQDNTVLDATCRDPAAADILYRINYVDIATMQRSEAWLERGESYLADRYLIGPILGSRALQGVIDLRQKIEQT